MSAWRGALTVRTPSPGWVSDPERAAWIGVPESGGQLDFVTRFHIPVGVDLMTVRLRGKFAAAGPAQIVINGWLTFGPWDCCSSQEATLLPFELRGGMEFPYTPAPRTPFVHGTNELVFKVAGAQGRSLLVTQLAGEMYPVGRPFVRGDVLGVGSLSITGAISILNHLFVGSASLPCADAADVNDDGAIDLSDAVGLLGYLYLGTLAPPLPFPDCGPDPRLDDLACAARPICN